MLGLDVNRRMAGDAKNTRVRVQVLVQRQLEHRRATMAVIEIWLISESHMLHAGWSNAPSNEDRVRKEEDPDAVPPLAVRLEDLLLVGHPVLVPAEDSCRVVDTKHIDVLDFEASGLDLADNPTKRARRIRTREDVLVHEETPDEVLVLPVWAQASDLEQEDTVVVEKVVDLAEERLVAADTDVLSHLKRHDLGVRATAAGDVAVVEAEDTRARGVATVLLDTVVAELGLLLRDSDASDVAAVVLVCKR